MPEPSKIENVVVVENELFSKNKHFDETENKKNLNLVRQIMSNPKHKSQNTKKEKTTCDKSDIKPSNVSVDELSIPNTVQQIRGREKINSEKSNTSNTEVNILPLDQVKSRNEENEKDIESCEALNIEFSKISNMNEEMVPLNQIGSSNEDNEETSSIVNR